MLDVFAENLNPWMLAFLPHGEGWRREIGVFEGAERNGDQAVELAVDLVVNVRATSGAEVEGNSVAAVGDLHVSFRPALDRDLLRRPARLDGESAARALLAIEAMADRHADGIAGDGGA